MMPEKWLNPFEREIDEAIERSQWFNLIEATLMKDLLETAYTNQKLTRTNTSIDEDYNKIVRWKNLADKLDELIRELSEAQKNREGH